MVTHSKLDDAFANCNEEIPNKMSSSGKCSETEYHLTSLAVTKMLHHFLSNSYCRVFLDFGVDPNEPTPDDLDSDLPKVHGDSRLLPHNQTDNLEHSAEVTEERQTTLAPSSGHAPFAFSTLLAHCVIAAFVVGQKLTL
jgi:hypothetical protein